MKQDPFSGVYRALSPKELAEMFMNPNAPKTEAEHWAVREIERLRADLATQQGCCDGAAAQDAHIRQEREEHRAEVEKLRAENERMHASFKNLALKLRRGLEGKP